jgi:signal transduction histidine kinase
LEELSRAFNGLLERLHESFERQRRFTGDASHQLRTPLTAMLGQIEVALRRDRPSEEYQRVLNLIHRQANRLRQIVEMLLFLAHADAEAKLPHLETLNLAGWLSEHLQSWSEHPRQDDLRMENASDTPLLVTVHPALLGQLVDNLLDNAFKHSERGTVVALRLWREQEAICLAVIDAGGGISPEDLPHVFEPFYRSSKARRLGIGGVGLGLAVVHRIAAVFGGSIGVKSELGKGSCFLLQLPHGGASATLTGASEDRRIETGPPARESEKVSATVILKYL